MDMPLNIAATVVLAVIFFAWAYRHPEISDQRFMGRLVPVCLITAGVSILIHRFFGMTTLSITDWVALSGVLMVFAGPTIWLGRWLAARRDGSANKS